MEMCAQELRYIKCQHSHCAALESRGKCQYGNHSWTDHSLITTDHFLCLPIGNLEVVHRPYRFTNPIIMSHSFSIDSKAYWVTGLLGYGHYGLWVGLII